jgi:hypothetical protein
MPALSYLLAAVSLRDVATKVAGEAGQTLAKQAERTIEQFLDDYCGTPPRVYPWPWPGPPPWVFQLISQLNLVANTLQAGSLREGLIEVAARAVERATAPE